MCAKLLCKNTCVVPITTCPSLSLAALQHDDSVNQLQNRVVRAVTDGFKNPNGCNVPATWRVAHCSVWQGLPYGRWVSSLHHVLLRRAWPCGRSKQSHSRVGCCVSTC